MKRPFLIFILILVCAICPAQTIQNGMTLEYQGKEDKTPLSNVTINAGGATARSNASGFFKLPLEGYRIGDPLNADVNNVVTLQDYVLFNKAAVEQWTVSQKGNYFTLVLCRKSRFDNLVKQYYGISEQSYKKQYEAEKKEVQKLKNEGRIKEDEYARGLAASEARYNLAMSQLQGNAELMARIDESELDSLDQKAVELIRGGLVDDAVNLIKQKNIPELFNKAFKKLEETNMQVLYYESKSEEAKAEIQKLTASARNDIVILSSAGGKENLEKCNELWRMIATYESENYEVLIECGHFFLRQQNFFEAEKYATLARRIVQEKLFGEDRINAELKVIELLFKISSTKQEFKTGIELFREISDNYSGIADEKLMDACRDFVMLVENAQSNALSKATIKGVQKYIDAIRSSCPSIQPMYLAELMRVQANIEQLNGNLNLAIEKYDEALSFIADLDQHDEQVKRLQVNTLIQKADCCEFVGKLDSLFANYNVANRIAEELFLVNPEGNMDILAATLMGNAYGHKLNGDFSGALELYKKSCALYSKLFQKAPQLCGPYVGCLLHLKDIYLNLNDIDSARHCLDEAISTARALSANFRDNSSSLAVALCQSAYVRISFNDLTGAVKELKESYLILTELARSWPENYLKALVEVSTNLSLLYHQLGCDFEFESTLTNVLDFLSTRSRNDMILLSIYNLRQVLASLYFQCGDINKCSGVVFKSLSELKSKSKQNPLAFSEPYAIFLQYSMEIQSKPIASRLGEHEEIVSIYRTLYDNNPSQEFAEKYASALSNCSYALIFN